jgi:hypothetical protein
MINVKTDKKANIWLWHSSFIFTFIIAILWALQVTTGLNNEGQRNIVPISTVWGLHASFGITLIALIALFEPIKNLLSKKEKIIGLLLAILGYAACGLAPQTNRIFYDEHIYMQIGQTIAHTGRAEYARQANAENEEFTINASFVNKQPNGHPYLLSWAYKIGGVSENTAHTTTRILIGLATATIYFSLIIIFTTLPKYTPIAAALGFIFTPLVLWWGHTVAVEPSAVATTTACFFAMCLHSRLSTPTTGLLLAATASLAGYFRPESLLVYPVAASILWATNRQTLKNLITWTALAFSFALLTPNLLHLWSVRTEDWGATNGCRFDFSFLAKNLASNGGYFFQQSWYPLTGTILALLGIGWLLKQNKWLGFSLLLWFFLSWGIFILFYAGGYHYGASSRYALISALPVALFVGIGASTLFLNIKKYKLILATTMVIIGLNWIDALKFVPTIGREAKEARADVNFVRKIEKTLPQGSLIISMNTCIWNLLGRNSAQLDTVDEQIHKDLNNLIKEYPGGIYLHWDYWMNAEPDFAKTGNKLIEDTQATELINEQVETKHLKLYRIDTAYALKISNLNK